MKFEWVLCQVAKIINHNKYELTLLVNDYGEVLKEYQLNTDKQLVNSDKNAGVDSSKFHSSLSTALISMHQEVIQQCPAVVTIGTVILLSDITYIFSSINTINPSLPNLVLITVLDNVAKVWINVEETEDVHLNESCENIFVSECKSNPVNNLHICIDEANLTLNDKETAINSNDYENHINNDKIKLKNSRSQSPISQYSIINTENCTDIHKDLTDVTKNNFIASHISLNTNHSSDNSDTEFQF